MQRTCAGCGREFEAKRSTAKYCGGTCRQRGNRRPVEVGPPDSEAGGLAAAVRDELQAAGRLNTSLGQQAVALAERMGSTFDTGSAVASLSKELRAVMAEALKGVGGVANPLDELRARRDRKRNAG